MRSRLYANWLDQQYSLFALQKRALENSLRVGREYGAMMVERNKALQSAVARKRKNSSAKSRKAEVNEVKAKLGQ